MRRIQNRTNHSLSQFVSRPGMCLALGIASLLSPLPALPQDVAQDWFSAGQDTVQRNLELRNQASSGIAKNVILFIGDGMGISTVTAARIREGQLRGETGEENSLSFEEFPNVALSKTYNTDAQVADSAGTMSAMATGVKTKAGVISVSPTVIRGDCSSQAGNQVLTFLERAEMRGLATGVVSTARLTHATPAANYAHIMDRDFEDDADAERFSNPGDCPDIARQLIEFESKVFGSDGLEVAMGGGRLAFIPNDQDDPEYNMTGNRLDGRNLAQEWVDLAPNSHYVWNKEQFDSVDAADTDHLLALFEPSHMQYEHDRPEDGAGEPSLSEMTTKAIEILSKNEEGYYLTVEAGRIDHAHHATNPFRALADTVEFSNAIRTATGMVDLSETLIIVTADHSHVFTIAGYPRRGNPILGKSVAISGSDEPVLADDDLPYTTLGYANGSSYKEERSDLSAVDTTAPDYQPQVTVPLGSETHGGEDVAIYAVGPGSDLIRGVMEQNVIFHVMMEASQLSTR